MPDADETHHPKWRIGLPLPEKGDVESPENERWSRKWIAHRIAVNGLKPRYAAYAIGGFWIIAVVAFGIIERLADPKTFTSIWLGIWWAIQTVTTVGYGDIVPQQTSGKVMASILMIGGLSLLAVVTAVITSAFVEKSREEKQLAGDDPVMQKLDEVAQQLADVHAELAELKSK